MCCHHHYISTAASSNWITSAKDIALVVLSATAIIAGYLQSRKNRKAEWAKEVRLEVAKILATSTGKYVSESEFIKQLTESVCMLGLYLDDNNNMHTQLTAAVEKLINLWMAQRKGERRNEDIHVVADEVRIIAKNVIKSELKKF